ncbi:Scavenger receptor class F member 1 [Collichthys lucidus]|uniref:Scavenger receptor class F member 1 n=1 Tax=Collichthys lucidus TaxID=240159 RepID=A0A4U5V0A5_COLLU|nr:Scavenger receptor class F member 1 [Collichthys lucidus]
MLLGDHIITFVPTFETYKEDGGVPHRALEDSTIDSGKNVNIRRKEVALTSPGNGKRKPGGFDLSGCTGATRRLTGEGEREKGKEGRVEGGQRERYCLSLCSDWKENKWRGKKESQEQAGLKDDVLLSSGLQTVVRCVPATHTAAVTPSLYACKCGRHGHCHPVHGNCSCDEGWWTSTCAKPCQCMTEGSVGPGCEQLTGRCQCDKGHWGLKCPGTCKCYLSPCNQRTGVCECEATWWGPNCDRRCNCDLTHSSCGPTNGKCLCHPGYQVVVSVKTTRSALPLMAPVTHVSPAGTVHNATARARLVIMVMAARRSVHVAEIMNPVIQKLGNVGGVTLDGPAQGVRRPAPTGRLETPAASCVALVSTVTAITCNSSCPALQFGVNCSSACDCGEGVQCDPVTGACPSSTATVADGGLSVRMKYHVYSVLANIGAALPCISNWSSGLPRVTVSHHDPELTFNHSFIEPPSSGWVTEGSSFDTDEEEAEALYCIPPREDIPAVAGGEFQEMSSKCNMFLDPSGFSSEDITSPFNIPRTSSIAKSKRPSVSFAEGTRFSPKERRGSGQDPSALPGHPRNKSKSPWGVLMLSALQSQGGAAKTGEGDEGEGEEREDEVDVQSTNNQESSCDIGDQEVDRTPSRATLQVPGASGRRRTMSNTAAHKGTQLPTSASDAQAGVSDKVTTVYVTVGKAGRPVLKTESSSEGPVQAMLRRLGSLQRQKEQESGRPKTKTAEGITKPPRKKLGARASVWEQGGPPGGEVGICKPIRRKQASLNPPDAAGASDTPSSESSTPKRPLSSILQSVPEVASADSGSDLRAEGDTRQGADPSTGRIESNYLTVGPAGDAASLTEVIANEGAEPCYENVMIKHS